MATPKTSRPRYQGTPDLIADAIVPSAVSMAWLKYGESTNSKVGRKTILKHADVLIRLRGLMPSLAFRKSDVARAMAIVRSKAQVNWKLKLREDEIKEWDKVLTVRLQVLFRHTMQALRSKRQWAISAFGLGAAEQAANSPDAGTDSSDEDKQETPLDRPSEVASSTEQGSWFGYDPHLGLAWRMKKWRKIVQ